MAQDTFRLQKALKAMGYNPGKIDGVPGANTSAALMSYLSDRKNYPKGVDLSHWQVDVDYLKMASAGVVFGFCKATHGTGLDKAFHRHWDGFAKAGIIRGAYHWMVPGLSLQAQAQAIFAAVGKLGRDELPVALDIERDNKGTDGKEGTADDIKATDAMAEELVQRVWDLTGKEPIPYSYSYYLDDRNIEINAGKSNQDRKHFWIADYRSGPPTLPPGWSNYLFHQYAGDHGEQEGVKGPCDLNYFKGTIAELHALAA